LPFDLPFTTATLVGTTDEPFRDDPALAVATQPELEYLVAAVNEVFPNLSLSTSDIDLHYAGVRPLPYSDAATTAAVTRRHWMEPNPNCQVPLYSIIGGKLTTCRSLAEEAAGEILERLSLPRIANSSERPITEHEPIFSLGHKLAASASSIDQTTAAKSGDLLINTQIPLDVVRQIIQQEWVTKLDDLVERRLMLLYHPGLSHDCLNQLADLLIEAGLLAAAEKTIAVNNVIERLASHFGKRVVQ
jgi:glycerol-3-phosphate dehydrogenase